VLSLSLKIDKIEYRAVIKFLVKKGLKPKEIHSNFIKVYGAGINVLVLRKIMLKYKNNFKTIHLFFHC
jgi:hypothetical protein